MRRCSSSWPASLDAARAAGAEFADVRIGSGRSVRVRSEYRPSERRPDPWMRPPGVQLAVGFGVRVLVGGAFGFAGGFDMTPDAVRRVAQAAASRARAMISPDPIELAAAPTVSDGRWTTPIERNAFDVPLGEQGDLQLEALAAAAQVTGVRRAVVDFGWQETDRVFASTAGTLLVQRLYTAVPFSFAAATAEEAYSGASESIESYRTGAYGYEAISAIDAARELRHAAERAVERSKALTPPLSVGVGRYGLVLSTAVMQNVIAHTLGPERQYSLPADEVHERAAPHRGRHPPRPRSFAAAGTACSCKRWSSIPRCAIPRSSCCAR